MIVKYVINEAGDFVPLDDGGKPIVSPDVRIAAALERIADALEKAASPPQRPLLVPEAIAGLPVVLGRE